MKYFNLIILSALTILSQNVLAGFEKHNFEYLSWSGGKSCLVCHNLKNGLPRVAPPNSRAIDFTKLTVTEKTAIENNPKNAICFVCHAAQHSPIVPRNDLVTVPGNLNPMPGTIGGSHSSSGLRVISRGTNMQDCLNCHDLHNKNSNKMLKENY